MRKVMKIMIRAGVALLVLPAILCLLLFLAWFGGRVHDHRIRCEVFAYVLDNRQSIDLTDSGMYQEFFYSASGMQDGGTEYGYYFEPNDAYVVTGEPYRGGYRTFGIPDDTTDWYYTERICENWFYYEIHDG